MISGRFSEFLRAAGIRAFRTFLQTLAAAIAAVTMLDELNFGAVLSAGLFAAVVSVITSLVSLPEIGRGIGGAVGLVVAGMVRAVRTAAQAAVGVIGGAAAFGGVDWRAVGATAGLAAAASLVTALLEGLPEVPEVSGGRRKTTPVSREG